MPFAQSGGTTGEVRAEAAGLNELAIGIEAEDVDTSASEADLPSVAAEGRLFGKWCSGDKICEIWRCEPLNVSNAEIPKNVVNRRHRFLTNDVAKASFKSVLECQPRKCG